MKRSVTTPVSEASSSWHIDWLHSTHVEEIQRYASQFLEMQLDAHSLKQKAASSAAAVMGHSATAPGSAPDQFLVQQPQQSVHSKPAQITRKDSIHIFQNLQQALLEISLHLHNNFASQFMGSNSSGGNLGSSSPSTSTSTSPSPTPLVVVVSSRLKPFFNPTSTALSVLGYKIHEHRVHSLSGQAQASTALDTEINKDKIIFIVENQDDPISGELLSPILTSPLPRRPFVKVFHQAHLYSPIISPPEPFEIRVYSLAKDRVVVWAGSRIRMTAPFSELNHWPESLCRPDLWRWDVVSSERQKDQIAAINEIEQNPPEGARALLQNPSHANLERLPDRAILVYNGIDSLSLTNLVVPPQDRPPHSEAAVVETAAASCLLQPMSLCFWQGSGAVPSWTNWLKEYDLSLDEGRGVLIISAELLLSVGVDKLRQLLNSARLQILASQG